MNNKPAVIEHPKSVQLHCEILESLNVLSDTVQLVFDHLDEKTDLGREIGQQCQKAVKAIEDIRGSALSARQEGNILHSSLVQVQKELPELEKQVKDLVVRLERKGKRLHEHQVNTSLTGHWAAVSARGNGRH